MTNVTFPTKDSYLQGLAAQRAIPSMTTLDVFHDCNRIAWYWAVQGLGSGDEEVRGMSLLYTIPDGLVSTAVAVGAVAGVDVGVGGSVGFGNRKVNMIMMEFNSVAWAGNLGRGLCAGGCAA